MARGRRFCASGVCLLSLAACLVARAGVIYEENFDGPANPGWTTNDPLNMYWDQPNGRYHVMSWGGSNTYAFRSVPIQAGTSYRLEFDAYVTRMDALADVRFGFGDPDMTVDQPATL
ncbi:MAG: hypothetical protein FJ291_07835 [Planctomycetes bacterium]|nr:hypothetical protein [Planctomycetota bacterium]